MSIPLPALSVRGAVHRARQVRELRRRRPHRIGYDPNRRAGEPTIYYLSPDDDTPRGGVRNIYRHVDILNSIGISAAVVHGRPGFRCTWFHNRTRVVTGPATTMGPADILVVPEYNMPMVAELPPGARKVVFNQNAYQTFRYTAFTDAAPGSPYAETPNLLAILTVSHDNANLLRYTFPSLDVGLARLVLDGDVFRPLPAGAVRERQIAHMPRRRGDEQQDLLHILRSRGALRGWRLCPIDRLSEAATAAVMRECPLFLSFSEREGFGLPPAEAMASGAYVIGFAGLAGRDFFDPAYCSPIAESDLLAFAKAIEETVRLYEKEPDTVLAAGRRASERILSTYHAAGLAADLRAFYERLL